MAVHVVVPQCLFRCGIEQILPILGITICPSYSVYGEVRIEYDFHFQEICCNFHCDEKC